MPHPKDKPHARIYRSWLDLPAWTTLSAHARCLLVELLARYRPMEPNGFEISDRTASQLVDCARNTGAKALAELEDRGWIKVVRVGRLFGPKAKRASVYELTYYTSSQGDAPTKEFLRWQPHPIQRLKNKPSTAHVKAVNGSIQVTSDLH